RGNARSDLGSSELGRGVAAGGFRYGEESTVPRFSEERRLRPRQVEGLSSGARCTFPKLATPWESHENTKTIFVSCFRAFVADHCGCCTFRIWFAFTSSS